MAKLHRWFTLALLTMACCVKTADVGAYTPPDTIVAGDRLFDLGNQWARNNTIGQLDGFEVVRISSYLADGNYTIMKRVTDANKKLMVGLAHQFNPPSGWSGNDLNNWRDYLQGIDTLNTRNTIVRVFRDTVLSWINHNVPVSAVFYNLESPLKDTLGFDPDTLTYVGFPSREARAAYVHAEMLREFKGVLKTYAPNTALWVWSWSDSTGKNATVGCDWHALTTDTIDDNAIDVCYMTAPIVTIPIEMDNYRNRIIWEMDTTYAQINGKPLAFMAGTLGHGDTDFDQENREGYHLRWNDYKSLVRIAKAHADSLNGFSTPVGHGQGYYMTSVGPRTYTQDASGPPPDEPIPWPNGENFPARLWENGEVGNWGYNQTNPASNNKHNKWEREFVANFLTATGGALPGHTLSSSQTWRGTVYLIGDVVIPSGVTLFIDPGTVINFRPNTDVYEAGQDNGRAEIIVEGGGALYAIGSINSPIVFQSAFRADENDTPSNDDWVGIRVEEGGTLQMKNCAIYDAKVGVDVTPGDTETTTIEIRETDFWWNDKAIKIQVEDEPPEVVVENVGIYYALAGLETLTYANTFQNDIEVTNWTVSDNLKGFRLVSTGSEDQRFMIKNAIVAYNSSGIDADYPGTPDISVSYSDFYQNSTTFLGDISGWSVPPSGTGNVDDNPAFVDQNGYDYHLDTSSPLLDAGDPNMSDPDMSVIEMGRYGGTAEHTPSSLMKPVVVQDPNSDLPDAFAVGQNFPNPFNPETTIAYALPQASDVRLVIYNALGQEVRTLINGVRPAGFHRIAWDSRDNLGRQVSSGIYLYRLVAGEFLDTRKMLILK